MAINDALGRLARCGAGAGRGRHGRAGCAGRAGGGGGGGMQQSPPRVGVFMTAGSLPHRLPPELSAMRREDPDAYLALEVQHDKDYVAAVVAYYFNLTGPVEVIQTACSASLVAIVRAVHALRLGLCDVAVCGGVSLSPDEPIRQVDGLIWSAEGTCKPFSKDAGGTATSDGAAVVVLTAGACARQCYAEVAGVAVNNDGRRKSDFSQPSHHAQVEMHRLAMEDAGMNANDIDYLEAHGTATRIGDSIEMSALAEAYRERSVSRRRLFVGSSKEHLGHTNTVAGGGPFF
mmetsp:Transcript_35824/g.117885  ORF Transcript_35824/g.117885 Transcript_35824/m.117885 type:complete len:289 (-) Transcript_35824:7-873(-)